MLLAGVLQLTGLLLVFCVLLVGLSSEAELKISSSRLGGVPGV